MSNSEKSPSENPSTDRQTLLNFPEKFPIKIFGLDNPAFTEAVKTIISNHVDETDILDWKSNASRKGNYLAVTVTIMARNQLQLDAIYLDLTANETVKMAL